MAYIREDNGVALPTKYPTSAPYVAGSVKGVAPGDITPVLTPEQKLALGTAQPPSTVGTVKGVPVPTQGTTATGLPYPTMPAKPTLPYPTMPVVSTETVPIPTTKSPDMNQNPAIEGTPTVENPFQTQYKQTETIPSTEPTPTNTSSSGSYSGGGGGGGTSSGGGGTGTGTTTPTSGGTSTTTTVNTKSEELFKQVQDAKFEYNAQTDPEFKLAASQLENEVAQMMVGRGGLYSSVTASAYQSRLSVLQVEYTKAAYERFVTERDFTMKMASFAADREDAAWQKNFELTKFAADREDAAFAKRMQEANLRIAQANAAYSRQRASASASQASAKNNLAIMQGEYAANDKAYQLMVQKWKSDGHADYAVAQFFKVPVGTAMGSQSSTYAIMGAAQKLNEARTTVTNYAKSIGDADAYLDLIGATQAAPKTAKETTALQNDAYNYAYSKAINDAGNGASYTSILADVRKNSASYQSQIGYANYSKLVSFLDTRARQEKSGSTSTTTSAQTWEDYGF